MPMIDEPPERFVMTPQQHRQWAANHEQLARAIERIERRRAEHNADRVPHLR
jgi:hypothetical protein